MWWIVVIVVILAILGTNNPHKKQGERNNKFSDKLSKIENFKISKKIVGYASFYTFAIDNESEKICYISESEMKVRNFNDIIGVELIEDGTTISHKGVTRTIGGAIVGGVLAGGAGAIIGGLSGNSKEKKNVSKLTVKILLRDINSPTITINCFDSRTMTTNKSKSLATEGKLDSYIYKSAKVNAEDIKDLVSVIIDNNNNKQLLIEESPKLENKSIADEILKLNELKEKGIITEDEFAFQKQKILNN